MNDVINIPSNWILTEVDEFAFLIRGITYSRNDVTDNPTEGFLPILRANNIQNNDLIFEDLVYVPKRLINDDQLIQKGDIIFAMSSGSKHLVGKSAQAKSSIDGSYGAFCALLRTVENISKKYVSFYFLGNEFRGLISEIAKGTNINNLKREHILFSKFPLPPLNEQHRIVSKIEELFSDLDNGVANLKKAQNQLKVYRQTLLKHAFEGKLTEQWRNENNPEPAEKFLERIKAESQQRYEQELKEWKVAVIAWEKDGKNGKKPGKPKPLNFLPSFDNNDLSSLNQLPSSWTYEKLGNLAYLKGGLTKGKKLKEAKLISLPYLRVANVQDGYLDLQDISYITTLESDLDKYKLENGDILYTEGGDRDKLGRGTIWKSEIKNCIHQNHIFRARPILGEIRSEYFGYYSQSKSAKNYFFRKGKQTTNLASINLTVLSNLPIPIASPEESNNIVNEIESHFSVIDNLVKTIESELEKSEALRQSVLKKAFEGKLVHHDPKDEPASELLKRLQAEKNKYFEVQKQQKKNEIKKTKKMSKELSIEEVLKISGKPMLAKDVWQQSKHKNSIEDFYKELKKIQENIKEVKKGTESLLSLVK